MNKVQSEVTNLEKDICIICKYNMDQYPNYTKYFYKSTNKDKTHESKIDKGYKQVIYRNKNTND